MTHFDRHVQLILVPVDVKAGDGALALSGQAEFQAHLRKPHLQHHLNPLKCLQVLLSTGQTRRGRRLEDRQTKRGIRKRLNNSDKGH